MDLTETRPPEPPPPPPDFQLMLTLDEARGLYRLIHDHRADGPQAGTIQELRNLFLAHGFFRHGGGVTSLPADDYVSYVKGRVL